MFTVLFFLCTTGFDLVPVMLLSLEIRENMKIIFHSRHTSHMMIDSSRPRDVLHYSHTDQPRLKHSVPPSCKLFFGVPFIWPI
jgi:hypothetical protein